MHIMPAGVHQALRPGSTGRTGFLPNRKGVQIGPQSNGGPGQTTAEQGRRAGRQSQLHRCKLQCGQTLPDQPGRLKLLL